jgi:hypothetical protein
MIIVIMVMIRTLLKKAVSSTFGVPRLRGSEGQPPKGGTPNQVLPAFQQSLRTLVLALLAVAASSAVAAEDGPEEVIRALYKVHRPWEHKEFNLGSRAMLLKYFSPELTKLFLKNAQVERDCPEGDLCGLEFDPILGSQDFDNHLDFKLHITEATPPQTGRFEARFKLFNEEKPEQEQVLVFQLIQVKNEWRIDDIAYTKDNTSLKAVLKAIVKEAADLKK